MKLFLQCFDVVASLLEGQWGWLALFIFDFGKQLLEKVQVLVLLGHDFCGLCVAVNC